MDGLFLCLSLSSASADGSALRGLDYVSAQRRYLAFLLETAHDRFAPIEEHIRTQLHQKVKVHADETEGAPAMKDIGFLPTYTGTVVHDCMKGYFNEKHSYSHALCNAHLLRECIGIAEHDGT